MEKKTFKSLSLLKIYRIDSENLDEMNCLWKEYVANKVIEYLTFESKVHPIQKIVTELFKYYFGSGMVPIVPSQRLHAKPATPIELEVGDYFSLGKNYAVVEKFPKEGELGKTIVEKLEMQIAA